MTASQQPSRAVVRAGGRDVTVHLWGAGDRTVVLVHGIGVSHRYFGPLARALSATARVCAVDLPGFGDSPRPGRPLTVADHARVLGGVLDELGLADRPVLVGHSMGAQVVTELAAQRPGLAERVVLLGPVTEPGARTAVRQGVRLLRDTRREPWRGNLLMLRDWLRCGPRWYLATLPTMLDYPLERRLREVVDPVLLVRGADDPVTPAHYLHRLAALPGHARVVEVPGEGHMLMYRRAVEVARLCLGGEAPQGLHPSRRPARRRDGAPAVRRVVQRGLWWLADYVYVVRLQLVGLLRPGGAEAYLEVAEPSTPSTAGRPVVLVPGVYEPWQFMRPLAAALHRHGHPVHVLPRLGYNRGPVPQAATLLLDHLAQQDLRDVVVVAHSKGGLIGKRAMLDDVEGRIRALVAINTPFAGSVYARWFPIRTVRAFAPSDRTLRALAIEGAVNSRITSVFTRFDPHIPGGSVLDGAVNIELATPGHFRVLSDPVLERVVLDVLRAG